MQLRRAASDIDRVRRRLVKRAQTRIHRFARHHRVAAVGTCIDVTVAAGHVAQLAEVDLKDFEDGGSERVPAGAAKRVLERLAADHARIERRQLLGRIRQRRAPRRERGRHIPTFAACSFICIPCTSDAPPRIAQATWTASVI